jgi:tRNA nucleotidyltransferase (CCA-adding enzyme)
MAAAFEQAALALTAAVTSTPVAAEISVQAKCAAPDREILFSEWLNAVIYEMAVRQMLFGRFEVAATDTELRATLWGEPVDRRRHEPACEPKGATFTELRVHRDSGGTWSAQCVVDV